MARPSSALVPSRRITIGTPISTRPIAVTMPLATSSPLVMPPKMLMKIDRTLGVVVDHLEGAGHDVGVGAAADVEEVGGLAADLVDDVDGGHGQPGAVGDHADVALEPDVLQALLVGRLLALVAHLGGLVLLVVGVAERRVAVERDLGVEGVDLAGGLQDQRVDLGEVGVALGVGRVELPQDVDGALGGGRVQLRRGHPGAGGVLGEAVDRVDPDLGDGVGVGLGDRLDLDAALGREHPEVLLGRAVEGEAGVVLLGDVGGELDPDDLDGVALDVHAEDVRRRGCGPRRRRWPA